MVVLLVGPGPRQEIGKLGKRDVHAKRAGARFDRTEPAMDVGFDVTLRDEIAEQQFGWHVGRDRPC